MKTQCLQTNETQQYSGKENAQGGVLGKERGSANLKFNLHKREEDMLEACLH